MVCFCLVYFQASYNSMKIYASTWHTWQVEYCCGYWAIFIQEFVLSDTFKIPVTLLKCHLFSKAQMVQKSVRHIWCISLYSVLSCTQIWTVSNSLSLLTSIYLPFYQHSSKSLIGEWILLRHDIELNTSLWFLVHSIILF